MNLRIINRSIRKNTWVAGTICVCSIIGSFILTILLIFQFAMITSFEKAYDRIIGPKCVFSSENEKALKDICALLSNNTVETEYTLYDRIVAKGATIAGKPYPFVYVVTGDSFKELTDEEIQINNTVPRVLIGDDVTIGEQTLPFAVTDIVYDPINSAPDAMNTVLYVNPSVFENIKESGIKPESVLNVYSKDPQISEKISSLYQDTYEESFPGAILSYEDIKDSYLFRYKLISEYIKPVSIIVFTFILLLAGLLTSMMLVSDDKAITTFRNFGMSKKRVVYMYVAQFLELSFIGGLTGTVSGLIVMNIWLGNSFRYFRNINYHIQGCIPLAIISICIIVAVNLIIVVVGTYIKMLDSFPSRSFSLPKRHLFIRQPFSNISHNHSEIHSLGLSYAIKRIGQTFSIILTTIFIGGFMIFTTVLCISVLKRDEHLTEWGIANLDIYVSRIGNTDEKEAGLLQYLDESESVSYYYAALSDTVFFATRDVTGSVTADIYDKCMLSEMNETFLSGEAPDSFDEIAVGMNFSKNYDISVGDTIEITHGNDTHQMRVTGIYSSYKQRSNTVSYAVKDIISYFEGTADGYYSIVLNNNVDSARMANELGQRFTDFRFIPMKRGVMNTYLNMILPLLLILVIFLIVFMAIMKVLLKMMLIDCGKDLMTYRYIGASGKNICSIIRYSIIPVVIAATALSIPYATILIPDIFKGVAQDLGLRKVPLYPSVISIILSVAPVILSSILVMRKKNILSVLK